MHRIYIRYVSTEKIHPQHSFIKLLNTFLTKYSVVWRILTKYDLKFCQSAVIFIGCQWKFFQYFKKVRFDHGTAAQQDREAQPPQSLFGPRA